MSPLPGPVPGTLSGSRARGSPRPRVDGCAGAAQGTAAAQPVAGGSRHRPHAAPTGPQPPPPASSRPPSRPAAVRPTQAQPAPVAAAAFAFRRVAGASVQRRLVASGVAGQPPRRAWGVGAAPADDPRSLRSTHYRIPDYRNPNHPSDQPPVAASPTPLPCVAAGAARGPRRQISPQAEWLPPQSTSGSTSAAAAWPACMRSIEYGGTTNSTPPWPS